MKKSILFAIFGLFAFFCTVKAETYTMNWRNEDGTISETTTCESGADIILPTTPTKYGYTFVGWKMYTPIEFILLDGTQYIDTGIIPNVYTKFRVKLNMSQMSGDSIIGYRTDNSIYRLFNYSQQIYFDRTGFSRLQGSTFKNGTTYDFLYGTHYVKEYTTDAILVGQEQFAVVEYVDSIKIGNPVSNTYGKIYLVQIWDGDTMVRDFIPVLDWNDVPCMYDKVTNQFFYNAGTGDFIAGPIINE